MVAFSPTTKILKLICFLLLVSFPFFLGVSSTQMSHLYSMFAKEVSKYCKSNSEPSITKCKHDLLTFGVAKLEKMNESHLDAMDPYQRSANDISKYFKFQFQDDLFYVK